MRCLPCTVCLVGVAGCMTLDGPCQIDVQREGRASRAAVQCEAGGAVTVLLPGAVLEAGGRAVANALAASAATPASAAP